MSEEKQAATAAEIDVTNTLFVGMRGDDQVIIALPQAVMTRERALVHAAWLVAVAEREDGEFDRVLKAVRGA